MNNIDEIIEILKDLKIEEINFYDLKGYSPVADYFIVASAKSLVQLESAKSRVKDFFSKNKISLKNPQEDWSGGWLIMDFGDTIINVFLKELRDYYQIDTFLSRKP